MLGNAIGDIVGNGGDNKEIKDMILTILGREDLLSMLNGTRSKPIATSTNPTGYTGRRIIVDPSGEEVTMNADDVFYYFHDSRRLYIAITIALSECDKQRYYLDLAKSRGRIGSIASQQCLYQLSILCK